MRKKTASITSYEIRTKRSSTFTVFQMKKRIAMLAAEKKRRARPEVTTKKMTAETRTIATRTMIVMTTIAMKAMKKTVTMIVVKRKKPLEKKKSKRFPDRARFFMFCFISLL